MKCLMKSRLRPSNSSASVILPVGASKTYSFSTLTQGNSRRCRFSSPARLVCSFSLARNSLPAESHSSRVSQRQFSPPKPLGLEAMLSGEITLAKTILRDYINGTVGFTGLAEATHIPPKSLMRMFSAVGNPRAANLFEIVSFLQHREGVRFHVR